jgi:hypothetical protein
MAASAGFFLAGCASEQQQQRQQQAMAGAAAREQYRTDSEACKAKFSESNKDAVARADCFNEADRKYIPTTRYPDLEYLLIAKRTELAERQAAGKITHAQAALELQQLRTQLTSEEQRRNNANAAAAANDTAAALMLMQTVQQANKPYQLPMPTPPPPILNTSCQTYGNNTSCQTR